MAIAGFRVRPSASTKLRPDLSGCLAQDCLLEGDDLAAGLDGKCFRLALAQERSKLAIRLLDKERRLAEQLQSRLLIIDVRGVELGACRLEFGDGLEEFLESRIVE